MSRSFLRIRVLRLVAGILMLLGMVSGMGASAQTAEPVVESTTSAPVVLPRTIPFKQDSAPASGDASSSLAAIALALALGLAAFGVWAWRKRALSSGPESAGKGSRWWGAMPSRKNLLLHGSTRLSPRHSVHEIEWRGRRLLIGCADQTMTLLSECAVPESPEAEDKP